MRDRVEVAAVDRFITSDAGGARIGPRVVTEEGAEFFVGAGDCEGVQPPPWSRCGDAAGKGMITPGHLATAATPPAAARQLPRTLQIYRCSPISPFAYPSRRSSRNSPPGSIYHILRPNRSTVLKSVAEEGDLAAQFEVRIGVDRLKRGCRAGEDVLADPDQRGHFQGSHPVFFKPRHMGWMTARAAVGGETFVRAGAHVTMTLLRSHRGWYSSRCR